MMDQGSRTGTGHLYVCFLSALIFPAWLPPVLTVCHDDDDDDDDTSCSDYFLDS